ncbi:unnamed protein product [Mytilus coruscus]|uniref:DUF4806 domain-containing protein n=1 Tax=Mytilus coruscus TaxID=42192 RepID=A0A6J8E628_MYTCO|nr:unnamed protein product [Mytilus coruscus]
MWCLAVWKEGQKEVEDVLPYSWVQDGEVKWPPGVNADKHIKAMTKPANSWRRFELVKVKCKSASKDVCESFDLTSAAESCIEEEYEETDKRKQTKRIFKDFVMDMSKESENDERIGSSSKTTSTTESQNACNSSSSQTKTSTTKSQNACNSSSSQTKTSTTKSQNVCNSSSSQTKTSTTKSQNACNSSSQKDDYQIPPPPRKAAPEKAHESRESGSKVMSNSRQTDKPDKNTQDRSRSRESGNKVMSNSRQTDKPDKNRQDRSRSRERVRSWSRLTDYSQYRSSSRSMSRQTDKGRDRSRSMSRQTDERGNRSRSMSRQSNYRQYRSRSLSRRTDERRNRSRSMSRRSDYRRDSRRDRSRSRQTDNRRDRSRSRSRRDRSRQSDNRRDCMTSRHKDSRLPSLTSRRKSRQSDSTPARLNDGQTPSASRQRDGKNAQKSSDGFPIPEAKFQRKVFQLLLELRTGLNDLAGRPIQNVGAGVCPLPDLLTTRADTEEDFNNINELLKRPQEKKTMIEHLKRIGGSDCKDNVQKILRRVMSNELMAKYNMKGNRGKLKFESTEICKVIVETAKNLFPVTEHNIHQVTAAYLKYAPDRMGGGGRKKKADAAAGIVAANNGNGVANNANGAANNGNGDANNRDGADDRH